MLDVGGGTGYNAELLGDRLARLQSLAIVDLCPSLLAAAEERIRRHGWTNVQNRRWPTPPPTSRKTARWTW